MSDEAMNNFTPRAQQVLALARKEADRFNHNFVGTEHLLLGLIKLGQITVAAVVLPVLWRVSKIPKVEPRWIPACSIVVIALGGYWFIDRVF